MTKRRGTPLWVTIGCGCGLLVLLVIGSIVAAGFFGASAVKGYLEDMRDPIARGAKAGEILGAEELPEGYTAHIFLHIPWLFDMVVLSDSEPLVIEGEDFELESESIGEHLFLYFSVPSGDIDHQELERWLRGEASSDGVSTDIDLELESDQELSRGSFELGNQRLSYVGHHGELDLDDGDANADGIYSQILIECPKGDLTRAAVWFRRDPEDKSEPDTGTPTDKQVAGKPTDRQVAGTPADEDTLRQFMNHFNVCDG